jgi:hypothetical protein
VLQSNGISHVADHIVCLYVERVGSAVRETPPQMGEKRVNLSLTVGVAPRTEDTDRLTTRPERPARCRIAIVKSKLGRVPRGPHARQELVTVIRPHSRHDIPASAASWETK